MVHVSINVTRGEIRDKTVTKKGAVREHRANHFSFIFTKNVLFWHWLWCASHLRCAMKIDGDFDLILVLNAECMV